MNVEQFRKLTDLVRDVETAARVGSCPRASCAPVALTSTKCDYVKSNEDTRRAAHKLEMFVRNVLKREVPDGGTDSLT